MQKIVSAPQNALAYSATASIAIKELCNLNTWFIISKVQW